MKDVNIILPEYANPVPPIYGGAIEELIDIIVQENRLKNKVNLTVHVPVKDKETLKLLNEEKEFNYICVNSNFAKVFNIFIAAINKFLKLFHVNFIALNYYYLKIYLHLKNKETLMIFEGDYKNSVNFFSKKYGKENIYYHVHSQIIDKRDITKDFGHLVSISQFIEDDWKLFLGNSKIKYHVLKNSINKKKFLKTITKEDYFDLRKKLGLNENDFVIIYCGRIIPEKGVYELVSSLKTIENSQIKLLIIGSPNFAIKSNTDYLNKVQQLIYSCKDRVKFTGYIPNNELYKYYQISNLQVVPSMWEEAAGLVAIEGMTSGLPLIVTNSGGLIEYVNQSCAIIVDRDEKLINNLAENIEMLYNNNSLVDKMKKESLKRAEVFDKDIYYNDFINMIQNNL